MKNSKGGLITAVLLAVTSLAMQTCFAIEDHVPISKEAEAARARAQYNWDMDVIRKSLKKRAENALTVEVEVTSPNQSPYLDIGLDALDIGTI